ncbi:MULTISPECIES: Hcp family type VI secretion system effector [Yersinia]|uniref:Hcp family type VI secretion system effector n=1 Tax=Yersinia TaxID=629 RepID=UPI0009005F71|nr:MULTISPECIES: Hcp family type VI secretion system effector [Yersinia]OWF87120.1 Hcp1 family type VI secretion system effector [Yersinia entomophaga]
MANSIYLTLQGTKQGLISAGCGSLDSIGNQYQSMHQDQIFVYSLQHMISRAQNSNHHPIVFRKPIDKSSPLLGLSISENESLHCTFDFYRTNNAGSQEKYYTIELTNAALTNIHVDYPHSLTHAGMQPEEHVSVRYESIIWQHHVAGTSAYSIWNDRVL